MPGLTGFATVGMMDDKAANWQKRHSGAVRILHWTNAIALAFLLLSGLQIFNAHPALYWGAQSNFDKPALATVADTQADGTVTGGRLTIGQTSITTTGVLGASVDEDGALAERGFPRWLTWPATQNLATGRNWHFFFAWIFVASGLLYLLLGFVGRHIQRDLVPTRREFAHFGASIAEHAKLHFPRVRRYNVIQNITYLLVIFVLLPLMLLTGLTMSPGMDTRLWFLLSLFGGRQSARTIHFITAWSLVGFTLVHVVLVLVSGFWNNMRSMVTGWYKLDPETAKETAVE